MTFQTQSGLSQSFIYIHIYIYIKHGRLPTEHHRRRTQECSKALVVLLSFYWIKVSQLRFVFVFCLWIIQYAETFIRYIVTYYATYTYTYAYTYTYIYICPILTGVCRKFNTVDSNNDRQIIFFYYAIYIYIFDYYSAYWI